jgi:RNA polymerase sigma-70 factor (ECF subfamily)
MAVSSEPSSTSASLLQRVRRLDPDAWERLSALYGPVVYGWCRRAGLHESDAADAMQDVFRSVFRGIGAFQQDGRGGSFRGWLWSITRNQVRLFFRKQGRVPQAFGGSDARQRFAEQPDGADDPEPDDAEVRRQILHRALELVRGDFTPATWDAFTRITLQGEAIADVAAALGMTDNAVRQAKFRVLRRLREELDGQI